MCSLIAFGWLAASQESFGQGANDTPAGLAGGFGSSVSTGAGSFDPYERNASPDQGNAEHDQEIPKPDPKFAFKEPILPKRRPRPLSRPLVSPL